MDLDIIDLNKLRTFATVVQQRGISAAAQHLGVTRSAISQSLSGLERSLGVQLVHRVGRRIVLTRDGRLLHDHFADAYGRLRDAAVKLAAADGPLRGVLRVGLFLGFSRVRVAAVLSRMTREHPHITIRVLYASHAELRNRLLDGRVDAVFSLSRMRQGGAIDSRRLLRQELVLAGSTPVMPRQCTLRDIAARPLIDYYRSDPLIGRWLRHHFGRRALPPLNVRIWAATTDLALELVLAHAGLAVLPHDLVAPFVARRRVHIAAGGAAPLVDFVWFNRLAAGQPSPLVDAFQRAVAVAFSDA